MRVVLADDSLLIRQGVRALLDEIADIDVVAECGTYDELLDAVTDHEPDVVVTDIRMPPTHGDEGIRAALAIRAASPEVGVVVLSQFSEPEYVLMLFEHGSDGLGYLLKERVGNIDELERAIRAVASGGSSVDPEIIDVLVRGRSGGGGVLDRLTPRETEVLAAIAEGLNNAAIAERLVLSDKAVGKHINSIFSKLDLGAADDVHRRVKAVLLWLSG
ncbi:MAG: response regulator [Acidimicrobiales bacterium]